MDHVAILDKKRKLLQKIITGEKTIESRWYKHKKDPYGTIKENDSIYFKDSGEPITVKADVEKVLFFSDLYPEKIQNIIAEYGKKIGITQYNPEKYKGIQYVTLIFLKNVKQIEPFEINKKGFGLMAAWIKVNDINQIKK